MDAFTNPDATDDADKPYTLPAAVTLANRCESRAWDDATDDESRLLLEQAADMIRGLMARCVSLAAASEKREARRSRR
jgi:hypothetical protein